MTALDLSTPEAVRDFVNLCLHGRRPRTPAKLAKVMADWLRTPLHEHAPHLAELHAEAEEARRAADRAWRAYVDALAVWAAEPGRPHTSSPEEPK